MRMREKLVLYADIAELIRDHRLAIGMNQEELGKAVSLSRASIANIELGRQTPSLHLLVDMSRAFDVSLTDLLPAEHRGTNNGES